MIRNILRYRTIQTGTLREYVKDPKLERLVNALVSQTEKAVNRHYKLQNKQFQGLEEGKKLVPFNIKKIKKMEIKHLSLSGSLVLSLINLNLNNPSTLFKYKWNKIDTTKQTKLCQLCHLDIKILCDSELSLTEELSNDLLYEDIDVDTESEGIIDFSKERCII